MKKYLKPQIKIVEEFLSTMIATSGKVSHGCSCGCKGTPDGSILSGGCWGCPSCSHDNQGNHNCDESFWSKP